MGASRKLQTEIDRVLKRVNEGVHEFDAIWDKVYDTENANLKEKFEGDLKKEIKKLQRYRDQIKMWQQSSEIKDKKALMDSRKLIEHEMERFKVCEKETKTKAFSKEGLGQQPKTDPKERAKSETRDWLNNVVGDLESQIDNFEAELEGISGKKGKTRNPQLTRLQASIGRHKAHVIKLELILRLLDNDELSPDEVNDLKYHLDDYIECNQVDFDRFSNIDELYVSLLLDKVEALEDMVTLGTSGLVKVALLSTTHQNADRDQSEVPTSQDTNSDIILKTPPPKSVAVESLMSSSSLHAVGCGTLEVPSSVSTSSSLSTPLSGRRHGTVLSGLSYVQVVTEEAPASVASSLVTASNPVKKEENTSLPPTMHDIEIEREISREVSNQEHVSSPMTLSSVGGIPGSVALCSVPAASDLSKRNISNVDAIVEGANRVEGGSVAPNLASHLSSRMLSQQVSKTNDGTVPTDSVNDVPGIGGRIFSHSIATSQWRPQSAAAFQNQPEIRGRPEITPDQREKYLRRLQQVQQGHGTLLGVPHLPGANHKQLSMQWENSVLQQLNSQSSSMSPQLGLGHSSQSPALSSVIATQLQNPSHQLPSQNQLVSTGLKDVDIGHRKGEEQQQQQNSSDDTNTESAQTSGITMIRSDDSLKTPLMFSGMTPEGSLLSGYSDPLHGQPLQPSQSSASIGVIGQKSLSDLGTIGDNLGGSAGNIGGSHDQFHALQLLEAALHRLPQPKDSERLKRYVPRHPATTPASFPQTQSDIFKNPAFWKRLGLDQLKLDTLFFAFYYQQNTYEQYLAARELKRQSWRYHKQYNTWFQRHEEPEVTTDEYEKGKYVYFDFHVPDGWCQRVKGDFTFEYKDLEDDLAV